jgi:hypothetical protein
MSHRDFFSKTALKIKLSKDGLVPNKNSQNIALNCQLDGRKGSQNIALNCQLDGRKGPIFLSGPFPSIQRTHVCNFLGPDFFKNSILFL